MNKIIKWAIAFVMIGVVILFAAWWVLRWAGMNAFELVRDHLPDGLGLSTAFSGVIATAIAILVVVSLLSVRRLLNTRYLLALAAAVAIICIPLAMLNDKLSADQCFDRQSGKPLCNS